ncbi:efflux RND transporter permease subunit [Puteibacter caeruleilacunae]|nr:efflux RND transporter permease subunit [Puteibacter caeruleilacunae]
MNLTAFTINKSRVAIMIFIMVAILGISMFENLSQDSMPPYTVRVASVVANFPGASPNRVENLVTDKIEKKIQEIPEVKEINSQSRTGLSVVNVTLKDEVAPEDLQKIWDRIRRKLETLQFPESVTYNFKDDDVGVVYGIMIGLVSDGIEYKTMKDYADEIRDAIIKLPDAAKVQINGDQVEKVYIDFDNAQLAKYGLSSGQLKNTIASTNILYSGGQINQQSERIILEPTGNFNSIEDIKNMLLPVGQSGEVVYLGDITNIYKGYVYPANSYVRVDGAPALALLVSLKEGANVVRLGEQIDKKIEELQQTLPIGLTLKRLSSLDFYVDDAVDNFISNLLQSVVIVLVVMLIFLGLRTGLVIASLIPMVTLCTLLFMGIIDMGLNQVTLAALIMALGMMVDNAVVVSESIMVKMEEGLDKFDAAVQSCKELFTPLLISTLTTSAAFLSFYLAESVMGDIMGPLFVVITTALVASWLFSLTMVAFLSYLFIRITKSTEQVKQSLFDRIISFLKSKYQVLIVKALQARGFFILSVIGLFIISLFGFNLVPFIFFPDSERNLVTVDINLPLGSRIETTSQTVAKIESYIQEELLVDDNRTKGIIDWSSFIGKGPESYDLGYNPDEANSNYAHMLLNTSSGEDNEMVIRTLDQFCFNTFPDADIKVKRLGNAGGGTPIEINVSGDDPAILFQLSEQIKTKLKTIAGTKNIKDSWGPKIKKIKIDIDQAKARQSGVTNQDIAISLQSALTGVSTGEYREGDESISILMRNERAETLNIEGLESVNIYAQSSGKNIPLIQVASIVPEWQYPQIKRKDLFRNISVSSEKEESKTASEIMGELLPWLEEQSAGWPTGYAYELGGESKNTEENMGAVIKYLPLSAFIIIMLLVIQFNSVRKTIMVLSSIPLGIIGVVLGLILLRSYFGFMAFLGVISLAGIVINNAIVLLDRIELEQTENNRKPYEAIIEASLQRFRPILLTSFTTVFGMIPLYLGGGTMWEPMAASIMVGLLFATVITLLFIPVLYSILYKVRPA